jgi:hypothetical protein
MWCVEPWGWPLIFGHMKSTRLDVRVEPEQRRELAELAAATGLSSADVVRLAVRRMLANPGLLRLGGGEREAA